MKKENFNLEELQLQEDKRTFTSEREVKEFHEYLDASTKEKFGSFEEARRESNDLAMKTYIR